MMQTLLSAVLVGGSGVVFAFAFAVLALTANRRDINCALVAFAAGGGLMGAGAVVGSWG